MLFIINCGANAWQEEKEIDIMHESWYLITSFIIT